MPPKKKEEISAEAAESKAVLDEIVAKATDSINVTKAEIEKVLSPAVQVLEEVKKEVVKTAAAEILNECTSIDWNLKIDRSEKGIVVFEQDSKQVEFVLFAELLRIGRLRGIKSRKTLIVQAPNTANGMVAVARARVVFKDGEVSDGCGDCIGEGGNGGEFSKYATAMAETRAIARALRFGLGITTCSFEEVDKKSIKGVSVKTDGKASTGQKIVISTICDAKKLKLSEVLALGKVTSIDDLLWEQASKLIAGLNDGKIEKLLNK